MQCASCLARRPDNWGFDTAFRRMDVREQLRQHFLSLPPEEQVDGWDLMWQKKITPWDQNKPNPALVDALENKSYLTASPFTDGEGKKVRKKALVPGCGAGYDVQLFASYGFDAYGVDGSPVAVDKAEQHLKDQGKEQTYKLQDFQRGRGKSTFIMANFFEDDWLEETHEGVPASEERTFDIVYDYTFHCGSCTNHEASMQRQSLTPSLDRSSSSASAAPEVGGADEPAACAAGRAHLHRVPIGQGPSPGRPAIW